MIDAPKTSGTRTLVGWAILVLPLVLMFFLFVTPVIRLAVMSLTNMNGANIMRGAEFVGFKNIEEILNDPLFGEALINTFFSPILILRMLLCAALPLSLALLFMEFRSGARVALQALLAPVIFFSGAALTAIFYFTYYGPSGLLNDFLVSAGIMQQPTLGWAIGSESGFFGNILNLLLANGLALSLPLGLALFLAAGRGAQTTALDPARRNRELFSRLGRVFVAFLFCLIGFSIISLEGARVYQNPLAPHSDILSFSFRSGMQMMRFSYGAAAAMFFIPPLLIIGLGVVLFLERRNAPVSIRFFPAEKGRLLTGTDARGGKIVLLIAAGIGAAILLYALVTAFLLPWLAGVSAAFIPKSGDMAFYGPRPGEPIPLPLEFFSALFLSLGIALVSALICHALTAAMGFSLGYLRPKGGMVVIVLLGLCLFLSPAVLSLPYYFGFRELGLLNTMPALIIPYLISPVGALLFTWFFRGARDEKDWLEGQGAVLQAGAFSKLTAGGFLRLSLPVFGFYFLSSLNMLLTPFMMVSANPQMQPLSYYLFRLQVLSAFDSSRAMGMTDDLPTVFPEVIRTTVANFSFLQYLVPLALLIVSIFIVFPRLALVIRRKGEAAPAMAPEDIEKLKG